MQRVALRGPLVEGLPALPAKFGLMEKPQYRVVLLKAWTKK